MMNSSFRSHNMKHKLLFGFSLIELMITIVIFAALASIGIPAYQNHTYRANRYTATAILLENAQWLERYYTVNNSYLGAVIPFTVSPKNAAETAIKYNISLATLTTTSYVIQATRANSQVNDTFCGDLTINNTGIPTPATTGCWQ